MIITQDQYTNLIRCCILSCEYDTQRAYQHLHRLLKALIHEDARAAAITALIRQISKKENAEEAASTEATLTEFAEMVLEKADQTHNRKQLHAYHQNLLRDINAQYDDLSHQTNPMHEQWLNDYQQDDGHTFPEYMHRLPDLPELSSTASAHVDTSMNCQTLAIQIENVTVEMPASFLYYLDRGWRPPEAFLRLLLKGGEVKCWYIIHGGPGRYSAYDLSAAEFNGIMANGSQDMRLHDAKIIACGYLAQAKNCETGETVVVETYGWSDEGIHKEMGPTVAAFDTRGMKKPYPLDEIRKRLIEIDSAVRASNANPLETVVSIVLPPHNDIPPLAAIPTYAAPFPARPPTDPDASINDRKAFYAEQTNQLSQVGEQLADKLGAQKAVYSDGITAKRPNHPASGIQLVVIMTPEEFENNQQYKSALKYYTSDQLKFAHETFLQDLYKNGEMYYHANYQMDHYGMVILLQHFEGALRVLVGFDRRTQFWLKTADKKHQAIVDDACATGCDLMKVDEADYLRPHWKITFSTRAKRDIGIEVLKKLGVNPFAVSVRGNQLFLQEVVCPAQLAPLESLGKEDQALSTQAANLKDYFLHIAPEHLHERFIFSLSENTAFFSITKLSSEDVPSKAYRDLANQQLSQFMSTLQTMLEKNNIAINFSDSDTCLELSFLSSFVQKAMEKLNLITLLKEIMTEMLMAVDMILLHHLGQCHTENNDNVQVLALYQPPGTLALSNTEGRARFQITRTFDALCVQYTKDREIEQVRQLITKGNYIPPYDIVLALFEIEANGAYPFDATILALEAINGDGDEYTSAIRYLAYCNAQQGYQPHEAIYYHLKMWKFNIPRLLHALTYDRGVYSVTYFYDENVHYAKALDALVLLLKSRVISFEAYDALQKNAIKTADKTNTEESALTPISVNFLVCDQEKKPRKMAGKTFRMLKRKNCLTAGDKRWLVTQLFIQFFQCIPLIAHLHNNPKASDAAKEWASTRLMHVGQAISMFVMYRYFTEEDYDFLSTNIPDFDDSTFFKYIENLPSHLPSKEKMKIFLKENPKHSERYKELKNSVISSCKKKNVPSSSSSRMFPGEMNTPSGHRDNSGDQPLNPLSHIRNTRP